MYRPQGVFNVSFMVLNPTYIEKLGNVIPVYPDESEEIVNCSFRTFGGTKTEVNGVFAIKNTAVIECWYTPYIKSDTRLKRLEDGVIFEIMTDPEDIDYRHQFLKFKVERLKASNGKI